MRLSYAEMKAAGMVSPRKCGALCPEWKYVSARVPDTSRYCQRLVGHDGPHRAATREWDEGSKDTRVRAEIDLKSRANLNPL